MLLNKSSVDSVFPHENMRAGQRECINYIIDEFNSGKRIVLVEAPTGSGKSAIGLTIARLVRSAYYITIQKILQTQIIKDFGSDQLVDLKGRNAYPCTFFEREGEKMVARRAMERSYLNKKLEQKPDCGIGYCREHERQYKHPACVPPPGTQLMLPDGFLYSSCPYYEQLFKAQVAQTALMNFSSFLYQTALARRFGPRELLVIDECHQVEPQLMNFISLTFSDRLLRKYGFKLIELETPKQYWEYFIGEKVADKVGRLIDDCKDNPDPRLEDELIDLQRRLLMFMRCMRDKEEWVCEFESRKEYNSVSLKPVFVSSRAKKLLLDYGHYILMMSATILDTRVFCSSLGIDRTQIGAYRMKNRFPVENRPIYFRSAGKIVGGSVGMTKWGNKLVKTVDSIIADYQGDKGIIHTHNFAIADLLMAKSIYKKRFLYQKTFPGSKDQMLEMHSKSSNSIIVAPAMHEGLDLVGDLCYDQETEILTEFGWVVFPDLRPGVRVAAYDSSTGAIWFEEPSALTHKRASEWVEFDTMTNNLVVTRQHRMLWRDSMSGHIHETTADAAPTSRHYQFITAGTYDCTDSLALTDDQVRLAVAFQADGSWLGVTETAARFSFRRTRKIERFRQLLSRLEIVAIEQRTKRGDIKFLVPKRYLIPLRSLGEWDDSKLWKLEGLLRLPLRQRRVLFDELRHWDGSFTSKGTTYDKMSYCSSIPENIDTIQAVAALSGFRSDYNGHTLTYRDKLFATFVNGEHNCVTKKYDTSLPCYCATVSTGWLVIRRRGKVTVSGNSRLQIICKVPWPNAVDDKQLARRVELDQRYYLWLTALKLVQSYGRSIRSATDWAHTYIIDEVFVRFLNQAADMLPDWFVAATNLELSGPNIPKKTELDRLIIL